MKLLRATCVLSLLAGCAEDVGECDQDAGLQTVNNGGHVEFAGQAIINRACATGCHQAGVAAAQRSGAPAGLDFDLLPVNAESAAATTNEGGRTIAQLDADKLSGLRKRQHKVYDERGHIWQQVQDGLMPPDGIGESFRLMVKQILGTSIDSPCTDGVAFADMESKATRETLRNWLACCAPIVESYGGPTEANGLAGSVGYQFLACEAPTGATLSDLYSGVFASTGCTGCHPALAMDKPLDLSSPETAYATLVKGTAGGCNGKPYVKPNDPDNSFLLDVVTKDDPGCGVGRMPQAPFDPLTESQVQQIRDWISAGAPK
jgi:hypothetical protein